MACHTEGWAERRQPPSADINWLRHLAAPAGCRQEGKIFLARTVKQLCRNDSEDTSVRFGNHKSYHQRSSFREFIVNILKKINHVRLGTALHQISTKCQSLNILRKANMRASWHAWMLLDLSEGIHQLIPFTKGQSCGTLILTLMRARTKCWTDSGVASDVKRHDGYVMSL